MFDANIFVNAKYQNKCIFIASWVYFPNSPWKNLAPVKWFICLWLSGQETIFATQTIFLWRPGLLRSHKTWCFMSFSLISLCVDVLNFSILNTRHIEQIGVCIFSDNFTRGRELDLRLRESTLKLKTYLTWYLNLSHECENCKMFDVL